MKKYLAEILVLGCGIASYANTVLTVGIESDAQYPKIVSKKIVKVATNFKKEEVNICGGSNPSDAPVGGCYVYENRPIAFAKVLRLTVSYESAKANSVAVISTDTTERTNYTTKNIDLPLGSEVQSITIQPYSVAGSYSTAYTTPESAGSNPSDASVAVGTPVYNPNGKTAEALLVITLK